MKGSTLEKKNSRIGWTMVIIASVLILAFSYIPMVQAFLLSLKTGKGNNLTFGGVANYVRMLNDTGFKTTIGNTLILCSDPDPDHVASCIISCCLIEF